MTFGEKIKQTRLALNLSQSELAEKTGISERSLYTYEQTGTMPRSGNIKKLAEALNVSVGYLMDENETDTQKNIDQDMFLERCKRNIRIPRSQRSIRSFVPRVSSLAGGELDDDAKDTFFRQLWRCIWNQKKKPASSFLPKSVMSKKRQKKELNTSYRRAASANK